ncbi:MAG: dihydropteroate synthase [Candidatus Alcyoniella australis]|nr:dihydropteroate synthase [Candidatus Alcyoniella australis]
MAQSNSCHRWKARGFDLDLEQRVAIMGVVNVTPDSFSDGGRYHDADRAVEHGIELVAHGAQIVDVGGESTRPGADPVSVEQQIERVVPVIRRLRGEIDALISVDTSRAAVAQAAIDAGAVIVNDISALSADPQMADTVARNGAGLVLMHMRGEPRNMQHDPVYDDVVSEVIEYLEAAKARALAAGIQPTALAVDPGIGFGKTVGHNLSLLKHLARIARAGRPVLIGASRKAFIGVLSGAEVDQRLMGTAASVTAAILAGARVVRIHDVGELRQTVQLAEAIRNAS